MVTYIARCEVRKPPDRSRPCNGPANKHKTLLFNDRVKKKKKKKKKKRAPRMKFMHYA